MERNFQETQWKEFQEEVEQFEDLQGHVRVNACKDSVERLVSYRHTTVGWNLCVVKTGGLNATDKAASEPW